MRGRVGHVNQLKGSLGSVLSVRLLWSAFLLFSGIASLTYQVTWVRLLGLSMGSTSASISTVVGAFFLGLAIGSYFAERILRDRVNTLVPYIALELVIGLCGLALLPVLLNLDYLVALVPSVGGSLLTKFAIAMALFLVPTVCMGATFPVVAALAIRDRGSVGSDLSHLYSLNTAGAVLGACLSGFVFIPSVGLDGAIYIAAGLNLAIVGIGLLAREAVARSLGVRPAQHAPETEASEDAVPGMARHAALFALFCTGLVSIATEVGWTKYLSIFTGTTIYGFAAILTVFLIGIASGSWWVRKRLARLTNPQAALAFGLVLLAATLLLTRAGLTSVPVLFQAVNHVDAPAWIVHGVKYVSVFVLLFLPTAILGALFPLNLMLYCGGLTGVRKRVGRAYAVNTIAGIVGSVAAGFWIIPNFGTDVLLVLCAFIVVGLAALYVPIVKLPQLRAALLATAAIVAASYWVTPGLDYSRLIASVGYVYDKDAESGSKPKILYLEEGKAGVISVVTYGNTEVKLQNNGLNESVLYPDDPTRGLVAEQLLALVPYFLHDEPQSAFVVGFGGGITTRALTYTDLDTIRVVELEPAIINAGRAIAKGEIPALQDSRVTLEFNDARNTLLLDDSRYDIIVSQPSHPWLAGAANVFTTQFFNIAKSRLKDGGIYGQWVNMFNMDATTFRTILRSFYSVFPNGITFGSLRTGDYLLFGSLHELRLDFERINRRMERPAIKTALAHFGVAGAQDLMWFYGLSRREAVEVSQDAPLNTDMNLLTEVRLSRLIRLPTGAENPYDFFRRSFRFDLDGYFPEAQLNQRYYESGQYFLNWDDPKVTEHIIGQLERRDERLARALRYEYLLYHERISDATSLYEKHADWPDRVRLRQSGILASAGEFEAAERAAVLIRGAAERDVARAALQFHRKEYRELGAMRSSDPEARKWILLGLAQFDLARAGAELEKLGVEAQHDVPLLRVMVAYYGAKRDTENLDSYARMLAAELEGRVRRLVNLAWDAVEDRDADHAEFLIGRIAALNSDAKALPKLRTRVKNMRANASAQTDAGAEN
jgi:spermidine synthase